MPLEPISRYRVEAVFQVVFDEFFFRRRDLIERIRLLETVLLELRFLGLARLPEQVPPNQSHVHGAHDGSRFAVTQVSTHRSSLSRKRRTRIRSAFSDTSSAAARRRRFMIFTRPSPS